jgi:predicted dehydrogenase
MGRDAGQPWVTGEGYGNLTLRYPSGFDVAITSTGTYYGVMPVDHHHEHVWVQGSHGVIDWSPSGEWTLSRRAGEPPASGSWTVGGGAPVVRERHAPPIGSQWHDAFGLALSHLDQAVAAGLPPLCSIHDNLYVAATMEAAYRSNAERRAVALEEIMGERFDPNYGPGWARGHVDWTVPDPI